ncbi:MAG: serine/threonine protein kinase, partial [Planctomycetes bacterium]|nr:serine/threonine protein kinase [Planctomycetota bacterium]
MSKPPKGDPFEFGPLLGKGGMGTVYEVRRPGETERFALKCLNSDGAQALARFEREGEIVRTLDHPGIVALQEVGSLPDGRPYLLFDLVEGSTLAEAIVDDPPPYERALQWAVELCDALAHAHARGVVHRDLKPENVLLRADGHVSLADFGVAVALDKERLTQSGHWVGTPLYMAPEQIGAKWAAGPWTDVYALGTLLYELLAGAHPLEGYHGVEIFAAIVGRHPQPIRTHCPQASADLEAVLARCMAKDPTERYPDASVLLEELRSVQDGGRARA